MMVRLLALIFAGLPAAASAQTMLCRWSDKQQCDPGVPCRSMSPSVWATADAAAKRYQRCDHNGCDTYDAVVTVGPGAYTTFDLIGRGVFMKVGPGRKATEVVSLGNSVLVSQGTCTPAATR